MTEKPCWPRRTKPKLWSRAKKHPKTVRFVKTVNGETALNEASLTRARRLVGLKGYVTNMPADVMPTTEVISSYHSLWQVEASFG